jgi:hypothetical protein
MATKGTNAKIKELKGIKPEKITEEQLKRLQFTVSNLNRSQLEVGSMEIKKHELIHQVGRSRLAITALQTELEKEYGSFDVNINDGTINYEEDVKADS